MHYIRDVLQKVPDVFGKMIILPEKSDLYYLALILPYTGYKYISKGKKLNVYEYVINDGLKVTFFFRTQDHFY